MELKWICGCKDQEPQLGQDGLIAGFKMGGGISCAKTLTLMLLVIVVIFQPIGCRLRRLQLPKTTTGRPAFDLPCNVKITCGAKADARSAASFGDVRLIALLEIGF
jgi:hypothetical protein